MIRLLDLLNFNRIWYYCFKLLLKTTLCIHTAKIITSFLLEVKLDPHTEDLYDHSTEFAVEFAWKLSAASTCRCVLPENFGGREVRSSALCSRRHTIRTSSTRRTLLTEHRISRLESLLGDISMGETASNCDTCVHNGVSSTDLEANLSRHFAE